VSRDLLLALDLGTTRVRALVLEPGGAVRGRAERTLPVAFPAPGRVEQDPEALFQESLGVLREALANSRAAARDVAALGIATQRATVLAWEAQSLAPLAPAIGWQDQRTRARCAALRAEGVPVSTLASATKLEWWLHGGEARVAAAAARGRLCLGTPDVWLTARLTGGAAFVTDPGQASATALFDLARGTWSAPALACFGVPEEALPRVVPSAGVVGETPAALLGAPLPVAARAGDQQASCFAQGVHAPGRAKLTLGTSAMCDVHTEGLAARPPRGGYALALWQLPGEHAPRYAVEGTVVTAGAAVEWLAVLGVLPEVAALDAVARQAVSSQGMAFVPALQGLGTPFLDDCARGLVVGLTRGAGRGELARALIEGVAHRCVDVLEALGVAASPLPVDGGLAASELVLAALADFSGLEIARAAELETTALGAAGLAGLAVGLYADPAASVAGRAAGPRIAPQASAAVRHAARARWREALARSR
jgi:glycerol kinase